MLSVLHLDPAITAAGATAPPLWRDPGQGAEEPKPKLARTWAVRHHYVDRRDRFLEEERGCAAKCCAANLPFTAAIPLPWHSILMMDWFEIVVIAVGALSVALLMAVLFWR